MAGAEHSACDNRDEQGSLLAPVVLGFVPGCDSVLVWREGMLTRAVPTSVPLIRAHLFLQPRPRPALCSWLTLAPGVSLGHPGGRQARPLPCPPSPAPCLPSSRGFWNVLRSLLSTTRLLLFYNPEGGVRRRQLQGTWVCLASRALAASPGTGPQPRLLLGSPRKHLSWPLLPRTPPNSAVSSITWASRVLWAQPSSVQLRLLTPSLCPVEMLLSTRLCVACLGSASGHLRATGPVPVPSCFQSPCTGPRGLYVWHPLHDQQVPSISPLLSFDLGSLA